MKMQTLPDIETIRRRAAKEAVEYLNLLKVEAIPTVYLLLEDAQHQHPKAICSAYRARDEQISDQEKKMLKIRKNAAMSHQALDEISGEGLHNPIRAHELTVLRAAFVIFRHRSALSTEQSILNYPDYPTEVTYDVFHPDSCTVCNALHRKPVPSDWGLFPPQGCTCLTAPYGLHVRVDFIGACLAKEAAERSSAPVSVMEKVKRFFR